MRGKNADSGRPNTHGAAHTWDQMLTACLFSINGTTTTSSI